MEVPATTVRKGAPVPTLTIHPTGEVIYLDPGETVLEGLYKAGFAYTIGCRRGGCAVCKVDVLGGRFAYNRPVATSVLSDTERTDGTCLSCRAVPASDLTIEMRGECVRLVNPFLRQINEKARQRAEARAAGNTTKE
jgi:CDP-4-dehydro-6-deoxyglucose reductase